MGLRLVSRAGRTAVFATAEAGNDDAFAAQDWALFVGVSLIWGASFLLIAFSLDGLTPGMTTLLRVGTGAMALWALRLWRYRTVRIERADLAKVVAVAVVWVAIPFTLFPLAQTSVNSAVAGLLNGGTPLLVALVSALFIGVLPRSIQLAGIGLGFAGILLISLGTAAEGRSEARGVVLILLAVCCYGFAINMAPPLQAKYGGIVLMSSVLGIATVFVAPLAAVNFDDNEWAASSVVAAVVLGTIGTGIAYWIMASLVGRVGAIRASFITYLIPVVSLALGVVFRGDVVSSLALIGTPLTLIGAFIASRGRNAG